MKSLWDRFINVIVVAIAGLACLPALLIGWLAFLAGWVLDISGVGFFDKLLAGVLWVCGVYVVFVCSAADFIIKLLTGSEDVMIDSRAKPSLPRAPYWAGYGAYRDGDQLEENPNGAGTMEWQAWFVGWIDARIEQTARKPAREWWASRGFWSGIVMVALAIAGALQQQLVADYPQIATALFGVCGLLLMLLRGAERNAGPVFPTAAAPIVSGGLPAPAYRPPFGLCLPCFVVRVRDGDTVEVSVIGSGMVWPIRLLDCWAPELSEPGGAQAKVAAEHFLSLGPVSLWIPAPDDLSRLTKLLSFDRIPGHLFVGSEKTLSSMMVAGGHATQARS